MPFLYFHIHFLRLLKELFKKGWVCKRIQIGIFLLLYLQGLGTLTAPILQPIFSLNPSHSHKFVSEDCMCDMSHCHSFHMCFPSPLVFSQVIYNAIGSQFIPILTASNLIQLLPCVRLSFLISHSFLYVLAFCLCHLYSKGGQGL